MEMKQRFSSQETNSHMFPALDSQVGKRRISRRGTFEEDIEANRDQKDDRLVREARERFKYLITKGSAKPLVKDDTILDECFGFYCLFLEQRFRAVNRSHFVPCLKGCANGSLAPALNLLVMYNLLVSMAELVLSKDNLTLQDMIDGQDQFDTKYSPSSDLLKQLIFMVFGWMSMLYDPDQNPNPDKLQLSRVTRVTLPKQTSNIKTEYLHTFEQGFHQLQQPLDNLFCVFGMILPSFDGPLATCPSYSSDAKPAGHNNSSEYLILSFMSYYTLQKVAKIKIEWVESLNLHLEFDEGARVLKLFRYPSFCRLMYPEVGSEAFLYRILNSRPNDTEPQALFREILLSYRLLFGQDKHSWQAFHASFRNVTGITKDGDQVHDPLLVRLCGSKWTRERAFYRSIGGPEASNHYSAMRDFPFLGARLARLQRFSEVQNPHDWKVLWYDQRDIMRFYTFWAVIIFGGGTLVISICQLVVQWVFSWLQLVAAREQNEMQAQQNAMQAMQLSLPA